MVDPMKLRYRHPSGNILRGRARKASEWLLVEETVLAQKPGHRSIKGPSGVRRRVFPQ
jgi:hypothetical protein